MCACEQPASADVVLISFPSVHVSGAVAADSIEAAYCREDGFIVHLVDEVPRVLVARGEFVFFYRCYHDRLSDFIDLITQLSRAFDMRSLKILWHRSELNSIACLFSITRTG